MARTLTFLRPLSWPRIAAALIILLVCVAEWKTSQGLSTIPCRMDCGETFVALQQAQQFHRYEFAYGLMQDHATSDDLVAHPYLYTHNASLPTMAFPILSAFGFNSLWEFQTITLLGFALGLFYAFRATARVSGSEPLALIVLAFFASDYVHVFSFGLNALRAWGWLALFGVIYHVDVFAVRYHHATEHISDLIWVLLFSALTFCIGYDFWIVCLVIAALQIVFSQWHVGPTRVSKLLFILGLLFVIPPLARQIQVAAVLGFDFWWRDLTISAAIKVSQLSAWIDIPSLEDINRLYETVGVLRPPAVSGASLLSILVTFWDLSINVLLPSYGVVTLLCFVIAFLGSLAACLPRRWLAGAFGRQLFFALVVNLPGVTVGAAASVFFLGHVSGILVVTACLAVCLSAIAATSTQRCIAVAILAGLGIALPYIAMAMRLYITNVGAWPITFLLVLGLMAAIAPLWRQATRCSWAGFAVVISSFNPVLTIFAIVAINFHPFLLLIFGLSVLVWLARGVLPNSSERPLPAVAVLSLLAPALGVLFLLLLHRSGGASILGVYSPSYALLVTIWTFGCGALSGLLLLPEVRQRAAEWTARPTNWSAIDIAAPIGPSLTAYDSSSVWNLLRRVTPSFLAISVGMLIGLAVFAPLSLHIYLKHQFPLIAAPIYLGKAIAIATLFAVGQTLLQFRSSLRWVIAAIIGFLVADQALIQRANSTSPRMSTDWMQAVTAHDRSSIAISWISDAVDGLSHAWSVGVTPGIERDVVDRIQQGKPPFAFTDYLFFGQRDRKARGGEYLYPDYWLYFPVDQLDNFDKPAPTCRGDYIVSTVRHIVNARFPEPPILAVSVVPVVGPFRPGSLVPVWGEIVAPHEAVLRMEARINGVPVRVLNFNCIYGSYAGALQISPDEKRSTIPVEIHVLYRDGRDFIVTKSDIQLAPEGKTYSRADLLPWSQEPQPTAEALAVMLPNVQIAAKGDGWVMFDMKKWYESHKFAGHP